MFGTLPLYFVIAIIIGVGLVLVALGFLSCFLCKMCYLGYERRKKKRKRKLQQRRRQEQAFDNYDDDYYDDEYDDYIDSSMDDNYYNPKHTRPPPPRAEPKRFRNDKQTLPVREGHADFHMEDELSSPNKFRPNDEDEDYINEKPQNFPDTERKQPSPYRDDDDNIGETNCCLWCCCCCDSSDEYYEESDDEDMGNSDIKNNNINMVTGKAETTSQNCNDKNNRENDEKTTEEKKTRRGAKTPSTDKHSKVNTKSKIEESSKTPSKDKHSKVNTKNNIEESSKNNKRQCCMCGCGPAVSDDEYYEESSDCTDEDEFDEEDYDIPRSPDIKKEQTGKTKALVLANDKTGKTDIGSIKNQKRPSNRKSEMKVNENKTAKSKGNVNKETDNRSRKNGRICCVCCCIPNQSDNEIYDSEYSYDDDEYEDSEYEDEIGDRNINASVAAGELKKEKTLPSSKNSKITQIKKNKEKKTESKRREKNKPEKGRKDNDAKEKDSSCLCSCGKQPSDDSDYSYESEDYDDSDDEISIASSTIHTGTNKAVVVAKNKKENSVLNATNTQKNPAGRERKARKKSKERKSNENTKKKRLVCCGSCCISSTVKDYDNSELEYSDEEEYNRYDESKGEKKSPATSKNTKAKENTSTSISCVCGGAHTSEDEYNSSDDYYTDDDDEINDNVTKSHSNRGKLANGLDAKGNRSSNRNKSAKQNRKKRRKICCFFIVKSEKISQKQKTKVVKSSKTTAKVKKTIEKEAKREVVRKNSNDLKQPRDYTEPNSSSNEIKVPKTVVAPVLKVTFKEDKHVKEEKNKDENMKKDNSTSNQTKNHIDSTNQNLLKEEPVLEKSAAVTSFMNEKYGRTNSLTNSSINAREGNEASNITQNDNINYPIPESRQSTSSEIVKSKTPQPVLLTTKTFEKRNAAVAALFASSNAPSEKGRSMTGSKNKQENQNDKTGGISNESKTPEKTNEEKMVELKQKNAAVMALLSGNFLPKKSNSASQAKTTSAHGGTQNFPKRQTQISNYTETQQRNSKPEVAKSVSSHTSNGLDSYTNSLEPTNITQGTAAMKSFAKNDDSSKTNPAPSSGRNIPTDTTASQSQQNNKVVPMASAMNQNQRANKTKTEQSKKSAWKAAAALAVAKEHSMPTLKMDWDIRSGMKIEDDKPEPNKTLSSDKNSGSNKFAAVVTAVMAGIAISKPKASQRNEPAWDLLEGRPKDMQFEDTTIKRKTKRLNRPPINLSSMDITSTKRKSRREETEDNDFHSMQFDRRASRSPRFRQPGIFLDDNIAVSKGGKKFFNGSLRRTSLTGIRY